MSYRKFWRQCKAIYPRVYALPMIGWFRICEDRDDPKSVMEFYELGNGRTRYEAWRNAASGLTRPEGE